MKRLTCYQLHAHASQIVPAGSSRSWMDATPEHFAYRCLPLSIANAMGWEILAPCRVTAAWNGGPELSDLTIEVEGNAERPERLASSHFGSGILTFHIGYLFRTEPGIGIWVRGIPNLPKDGAAPLEGIVETDWLPFTFTMNWQLTRPGRIVFEKDEPFCFITLLEYQALLHVQPEIVPIEEDPALKAEFTEWSTRRKDFNRGLIAEDPEVVQQRWQKWYTRGEMPDGEKRNPQHLSKVSLATPTRRPRSASPL